MWEYLHLAWEYVLLAWDWVNGLTLPVILNILAFMGVCMAYTLAYNRFKHRGRIVLIVFTVVVAIAAITGALFPESMVVAFLQLPLALAFNTLLIHGIMARYSYRILHFLEKFPLLGKFGILPNVSLFFLKMLCVILALPMTLWFVSSILLVVYFAIHGYWGARAQSQEEAE